MLASLNFATVVAGGVGLFAGGATAPPPSLAPPLRPAAPPSASASAGLALALLWGLAALALGLLAAARCLGCAGHAHALGLLAAARLARGGSARGAARAPPPLLLCAALALALRGALAACPSAAAPGYFCVGSTETLCPVGAYCAGGAALNVLCSPATACIVAGLSAQPQCYWNVSTLAGSGAAGWADGQGAAAVFNGPSGVSVDSASLSIYVGDNIGRRVRKISPTGLVSTFAGSGSTAWVDGLGTAASFNGPYGTPVDALGNLYVAEWGNHRVRKILPSRLVSTLTGSGTTGGGNGIGTAAQLNQPTDIALDSSGTMGYIVEQGGSRIRSIVLSTAAVSSLAGSGTAGFTDNADGLLARFNLPTSAVWHPSGILYIADGWGGCVGCGNHRIRRLIISTTAVSTLAGNGVAGAGDGVGTSATLSQPRGISIDSTFSTLYVAETSGHRIRSISLSTSLVRTIAGSGTASYGDGFGTAALFNSPISIASSPSGVLYTADNTNQRIRQLTCVPCPASYYCTSGAPVLCPAGSFCPLSSINATQCPAGTFSNTTGASLPSTCISCSPGSYSATPGAALSTTCSPCTAGTYSTISGANSSAACLPCSAGAYSVQGATACAYTATTCPIGTYASGPAACTPCSPATACTVAGLSAQPPCYWNVSTLAGSGAAGYANGQGAAAVFNQPSGISVDPITLSIYVSDFMHHRLRKVSPTGLVSDFAGSGSAAWADGMGAAASFNKPLGVPVDSLGNVYVGEFSNHRVRKILPSGLVSTLAGSGTAGGLNGIGTAAQLSIPTDIALDSSGTMGYIVEQGGNRIRSIALSTAAVSTLAGSGTAGFADNVNGLLAQFNQPTSAVWHPSGLLYVADGAGVNNRIRIVNISSTAVSTLAGNGAAGGLDGVGTTATFKQPRGVFLDATLSVLYVAESSGNRIRSISLSTAFVRTIAGSGIAASGYSDGFGVALFNGPVFITSSPPGILYIADSNNHRIRQLTCVPCPASYYCASGAPILCPAGSFCSLSSINATQCRAGSLSNITGASSVSTCTPCSPGYYSTTPGAALSTTCSPCAAGTYSTTSGANSTAACLPCSAGAYSIQGSTACAYTAATCPIGTHASGTAACAPCSPATACSVVGLSAQPSCYWNVSTLAGSGAAGWADGQGAAAVFNGPRGVSVDPVTLNVYVGDWGQHRIRKISPTGLVSTFAGSGIGTWADGLGTTASFKDPHGTRVDALGNVYVGDAANQRVRKILPSNLVTTLAGSGTPGAGNGIGTAAQLNGPTDIALDSSGTMGYIVEQGGSRMRSIALSTAAVSTLAGSGTAGFADNANGLLAQFNQPTSAVWHPSGLLYVADGAGVNNRIRIVNISSTAVSTLAGNGAAGGLDGVGTTATFSNPRGVSLDATFSTLYVSEGSGNRIRSISLSSALVRTLAGSGSAGFSNGFGIAALFNYPMFLTSSPSGVVFTADATSNNRIRQLTCVPCPASYYCASGAPVLCPAGSFCPLSSINPTACPKGTFSTAGASSCTPCHAGTFTLSTGTVSCQQCPGGHFCPPGTSSWATLNCGRGNYCPFGSAAPLPCPYQVPPSGGWGALRVQGPAFFVDTSSCLNHCFWNFTSGDGMLSKC